jgi:hypothetical protein
MLDILQAILGGFFSVVIYFCLFAALVFWPVSLCYAIWRHLHHLKRIADALEAHTPRAISTRETLDAIAEFKQPWEEARISNSAFGR